MIIQNYKYVKLRYIYSASVVVETPDLTILSDPWFTPAEYGSWYHYPPLPKDPIEIIGKVDLIYISHLHSDHYDPLFLRKYLRKYPDTKIIISETKHKMLENRMELDGFSPLVFSEKTFGKTRIILTINGDDYIEGDTGCLIIHENLSIANMNDCGIDQNQIDLIRKNCPNGHPTVALLSYAGAGPYPQTYYFENTEERKIAEKKKHDQFLKMYDDYCLLLEPDRAMPFAGSYVLGGPLSKFNPIRGVADAVEVLQLDKSGKISFVLEDGGDAEFDLQTLTANKLRTQPYSYEKIQSYLDSVPFDGYTYEKEFLPIGDKPLPLKRLCSNVYKKLIQNKQTKENWWICLKPSNHPNYLVFSTSIDQGVVEMNNVEKLEPRWEIHLDERLLFFLLSGYYHWANAEGGSHLLCKRIPNQYVSEIQDFLYFLVP